jgi:DNA-binding XRE family transcriptional regulator
VLTTGNQLRAARGLVDMDQITLAKLSGVSANTIRAMEGRKAETLTSGLYTVRAVQAALEAAGVEFLNHGRPGARPNGSGEA